MGFLSPNLLKPYVFSFFLHLSIKPLKLKGKVYKTVVRPALLYGAETWATTIGQEARLEVNEMRMLRWMCGVTRRDKIRNEHIRGTTRLVQASKKITEK